MSIKILIIEDEKAIRDIYSLVLQKEGFMVEVAENGKEAIAKLNVFNPQIILLDMVMPVMDGEAFLKHAKLKSKRPNTKTIILSNLSGVLPAKYKNSYGVTHSVLKSSLNPKELVKVINLVNLNRI